MRKRGPNERMKENTNHTQQQHIDEKQPNEHGKKPMQIFID